MGQTRSRTIRWFLCGLELLVLHNACLGDNRNYSRIKSLLYFWSVCLMVGKQHYSYYCPKYHHFWIDLDGERSRLPCEQMADQYCQHVDAQHFRDFDIAVAIAPG